MKKHVIKYHATTSPIVKPISKLGGAPVWIADPQWPIGTSGNPMMFVCQVELRYLLSKAKAKLAYIFFTEDPVCPGYGAPDRGDCAVIIQPDGCYEGPTCSLRDGPTVYRRSWEKGVEMRYPVEFTISLSEYEEAPEGAWDDVDPEDSAAWKAYFRAPREEKIGGRGVPTANRMGSTFPVPDNWRLLIQLNSRDDGNAFFLNMAGDGTGYVFVSPDGLQGRFWFDR